MLTVFVIIIFLYFIYAGLEANIMSIRSVNRIRESQLKISHFKIKKKEIPVIVLLIPALYEQSIICRTLDYFCKLKYPSKKLKIVVLTTNKEERSEETTSDIVKNYIPKLNQEANEEKFIHLHYPQKSGGRAHQLNYAITKLDSIVQNYKDENLYIGVYDVDSFPDKRSLIFLARDALMYSKTYGQLPPIYQQPSLYLGNFSVLPNTINGFLQKAESLLQTRWSLGYEIPRWNRQEELLIDKNQSTLLMALQRQLTYAVGHGEYFRFDILKKLGGFPTYLPVTDDLAIGEIASFLNIPTRVAPCFDLTQVPNNISVGIKQGSTWFGGSMYLFKNFTAARKISEKQSFDFESLKLLLDGFLTMFAWLTRPLLFLFALLIAIFVIKSNLLVIFGSIGFIFYSTLGALIIFMLERKLNSIYEGGNSIKLQSKSLLLILLASLMNFFIRSFGPARYVILYCYNFLTYGNRKIFVDKTPR